MTSLNQGSAQIYQFPTGGRAGLKRKQQDLGASELAKRLPNVPHGSWYHDEAIEAERVRNH